LAGSWQLSGTAFLALLARASWLELRSGCIGGFARTRGACVRTSHAPRGRPGFGRAVKSRAICARIALCPGGAKSVSVRPEIESRSTYHFTTMRRTTATLSRPLRLVGYAIAVASLTLTLASCGGGSKASEESSAHQGVSVAGLPRAAEGIVARVGPVSITQATYERWFAADVATEQPAFRVAPIPPGFTACIEHLQQAIKGLNPTAAAPSTAQLKSKCAAQYRGSHERVLNRLITNEWIVGAAEELGVKLSNLVAERRLDEYKRTQFSSEAGYRAFLRETHQTEGDLLFQGRIKLLSDAISARLKEKAGAFTASKVASYYRIHRSLYTEPETRDLHIVRTETLREALKARRELASGKSFEKVAARLDQAQPIFSKNGMVHGLKPHAYSQPPLNNAIFSAKSGELSRPIHITLGYYVFEITKVHPPLVKPLSAVAAKIKREVPAKLQQQELAAFVAQWRKRWLAQTVCPPGFLVPKCRNYGATATTSPEDENPFT
jgi:foldase protein PrsA